MKTSLVKDNQVKRQWHHIDASGKILGRLAVKIANLLRGRHKCIYTPHMDLGDFVVITNAKKILVTGKKEYKKKYMFYTGYMGNEKYRNFQALREKKINFIIEHAVKGMLPRNRLAHKILKKLKIYSGVEHKYKSQNLIPFEG